MHYHLPWNQSEHFWLCTWGDQPFPPSVSDRLKEHGFAQQGGIWSKDSKRPWGGAWRTLHAIIEEAELTANVHAAVLAQEARPTESEARAQEQPLEHIEGLAKNLWLGEAMLDGRFKTYLQPIMDRRGKVFGYEAFARCLDKHGETIDGGTIFHASRGLQAEHALDRYLQVQAIKNFITSGHHGFLFVNMIPGFIHLPERYLQGLTETARALGLPSKYLVIDVTYNGDAPGARHLRAILDYCKTSGYATSLDDITSLAQGRELLQHLQADHVRINLRLVHEIDKPSKQREIREIVDLVHQAGSCVIAEGVETKEQFELLSNAGVDLFQGYYFSPPIEVKAEEDEAAMRNTAALH